MWYQIIWRKDKCFPFHVLIDDDSLTLEQLIEKGKGLKSIFPKYDIWLINENWDLLDNFEGQNETKDS